jgi:hypothetical protein
MEALMGPPGRIIGPQATWVLSYTPPAPGRNWTQVAFSGLFHSISAQVMDSSVDGLLLAVLLLLDENM